MINFGVYSELDYLILALIGNQVNNGYAIRKEMVTMRGGRWSSESGAVYRVLQRLSLDRLIAAQGKAGIPKRERTEYVLTATGEALVHRWLTFPPAPSEFSFMVDPIRTRSYFLSTLKPTEQIRVIKRWMVENRQMISELSKEQLASSGAHGVFHCLAHKNLIFLAEGRQEWLKFALAALKAHHAELGASETLSPDADVKVPLGQAEG